MNGGAYISGLALGVVTLTVLFVLKKKRLKTKGSYKDVVDFFMENGFSSEQSIGIAGNLQEESQFNTLAVGDNGTAFGLAQWRGSRLENLKSFSKDHKLDYRDFFTQLNFILHEFKTDEKNAFNKLMATKNLTEATIAFAKYYERPQASTYPKRVAYANNILNKIQNT